MAYCGHGHASGAVAIAKCQSGACAEEQDGCQGQEKNARMFHGICLLLVPAMPGLTSITIEKSKSDHSSDHFCDSISARA